MSRQSTTWTCPECDTTQAVDRDEDGLPAPDTTPCHSDDHKRALCQHCPQFVCDHCRLTHCKECEANICDLKLCPVCVRLLAQDAAELFEELELEAACV